MVCLVLHKHIQPKWTTKCRTVATLSPRIFPHWWSGWETIPTLRARLLPTSEPYLRQVRLGPKRQLHHCMRSVYFPRLTLHLLTLFISHTFPICEYCTTDKKYHVEHFTCLLCPQLFGPNDSYYEHEGASIVISIIRPICNQVRRLQ